ncbi:hypothetical protein EW146_g942 [Bondarzewia mesenterica]|uniref:Zn(2)-C6 fungal-type domain-containing protein n=1 Tax=Bondarzewia mesenterica TaxID=1095465 RepID=A0A4S4M7K7_9AGAM|nr:hypothetical protein EW146_g942 [Bondarzewia mesenterica]
MGEFPLHLPKQQSSLSHANVHDFTALAAAHRSTPQSLLGANSPHLNTTWPLSPLLPSSDSAQSPISPFVMPTDHPKRPSKKREATKETSATPDEDHRKRRRNRTTQSCLQCHHSKRMCDRKRPCGRCTQLGLVRCLTIPVPRAVVNQRVLLNQTGLCVYEVDDPSQANDSADDTARLQKRVAELESVIREVRICRHVHRKFPVQLVPADGRSHSGRTRSPPQSAGKAAAAVSTGREATPLRSIYPASPTASSASRLPFYHPPSPMSPSRFEPELTLPPSSASSDAYSPSSSGAPLTPSLGHIIPSVASPLPALSDDTSIASLFSYFQDLHGFEDPSFAKLLDDTVRDFTNGQVGPAGPIEHYHDGDTSHCGCLTESAVYSVVLELSLRLRKAAETLNRHPVHARGSACALQQRITELDAFANLTLGSVDTPNEFDRLSMGSGPKRPTMTNRTYRTQAPPSNGAFTDPVAWTPMSGMSPNPSTISPQSLLHRAAPRSSAPLSAPPRSHEDPFMSWVPQKRHDWSMRSVLPPGL